MRVVVCLAVFAAPGSLAAQEKPNLVVEVIAPKEVYPDEPPDVRAVIRNAGKADAYIVRAIDGSFDGLRSVVDYKWVVKQGAGRVGRRTDIVRIDSNVNQLADEDVLLVKPGKEVDTQAHGFGNFANKHDLRVPGKYTIALSYELNPAGFEQGSETALKRIRQQPAVLVASRPVEVTVLPFPPAVAKAEDAMKAAEARLKVIEQFATLIEANANSTARERDEAAERLRRALAVLEAATADHAAKYAEFKKQRDEKRKKK